MTDTHFPGTRRRQTAGIMPVDAGMLADWLAEFGDRPGFELTHEADEGERRVRLLDVSMVQRTLERPAAAPTIECLPAEVDPEPFTVRVDNVVLLETAALPEHYDVDAADSPEERAAVLARLARVDPDQVRVATVLGLLDRENPKPRADALRALRHVAEIRPADCAPAVPIVRDLLADDELDDPTDALATLGHVAADSPADVAPVVDVVGPSLEAERAVVRTKAARCASEVAAEAPGDLLDLVPLLATCVSDASSGATPYAVYALNRIAAGFPAELKPVAGELSALVVDDEADDSVRLNATAALGRVVGEYPSLGLAIVGDLVELFDADSPKLRNNAVGLVGDVAKVHTDAVEPHVEEIRPLLAVEDTYTRVNASAALSRVARDFPDSLEAATGEFLECLVDESDLVRLNACWGLGHLARGDALGLPASRVGAALEERSTADDESDVRLRAQWALAGLEE